MNKKTAVSFAAALVISVIALYFAFKNVPFVSTIEYLRKINYLWLAPAILLVLVAFAIRALRWQIILATSNRVSFSQALHPLMIGFMLNLILPGRVGEIARPMILQKKENIPFSVGLATVAAERLFDMLTLLGLLALVMTSVDIDPSLSITYGDYQLSSSTLDAVARAMGKIIIMLVIGIFLLRFSKTRNLLLNFIAFVPKPFFRLSEGIGQSVEKFFSQPLAKIIQHMFTVFSIVNDPAKLFICLFLSIFAWLVHGMSYYVLAAGFPAISLSLPEHVAIMVIICFFIALPAVPGFWGLWEAGGVFAMTLFGIPEKNGLSFTLVNHVAQIIPVVLAGFISAWLIGLNPLTISKNIDKIKK